jgi:alcohol dehydrogenase (cytochrome c)/quinohemoprotein ethanol dehydrogenase
MAPGILSANSGNIHNISRLLVFKIGGKASLPAAPDYPRLVLDPPPSTGTAAQISLGGERFGRYCATCHGDAAFSGGINPDLRYSATLGDAETFRTIVHDGALKDNGMVAFSPVMSTEEVEAIRHYLIRRANEDKALESK